ncbi:hypothetical protein [Zavarzinia sp.]|uniref:hypothetical protein n=1 Tax=Zavarzinia sp. TaxID=2027920 RepID=UPI003BB6F7B3
MELAEVASALAVVEGAAAVFKTSRETIRAFIGRLDRDTQRKIEASIDEMTDNLRATKDAIAALADRCRELEKERSRLIDFKLEAKDYELRAIGPNSFAYAHKSAAAHAQENPSPYLCANCFDRAEKSVLQLAEQGPAHDTLKCARCKAEVLIPGSRKAASASIAPVKRSRRFEGDW